MIKHIFTLLWNRRRKNVLLFVEVFIAFFILYFVFTYAIENLRKYSQPLGFEYENIWSVRLMIPGNADSLEVATMKETLKRELLEMPEIESIGFGSGIDPFSYNMWSSANNDNGFEMQFSMQYVDEDYAKTLGLNITAGRWFDESDATAKYPPVVVNQKFVDEYFSGKSIVDSIYVFNRKKEHKIIGIVDYYKHRGEFEPEYEMAIFRQPYSSKEARSMFIRLKDGVDKTFEQELNQTIAQITKTNDFIIDYLDSQRKRQSRSTWIPMIALLSICTFLILNVALGLFGVLWYNISKRKGEIGLRRAMGATKSAIAGQFMGEILLLVGLAVFIATIFAIQIPLLDVVEVEDSNFYYALLASILVILLIVLLCTLYPSLRASRIQPAVALHEE
jgi:putative ABC transport system permease protein